MKLLVTDIETAPITAHTWGLFKQNIATSQIIDTGRVMCFAARWYGKRGAPMFVSERWDGHEETIMAAHKLLDEADAVLTFNGERFDLPTLNKEFVKYGLSPPSPYQSIDMLKVVRRRFRFASNKLEHLAKELGLTRKVSHRGFDLWIDCMKGDHAAWREMRKYNKGDVVTLTELYEKCRPWIDTHPNTILYSEDDPMAPVCPVCKSDKLQKRGYQATRTQTYQRYQCSDCGSWLRSRYTARTKNKNVLTTCAA